MRSRSDIHSSACSVCGMPSHRFSMLASVGLEMACVEAAARGTVVVVLVARRPARRSEVVEVRIILTIFYLFYVNNEQGGKS